MFRVVVGTGVSDPARSTCSQSCAVGCDVRELPPCSFGNPLMAYVPGGGMAPAADDKPAAAPVKRAVKKGAKGGSCCC